MMSWFLVRRLLTAVNLVPIRFQTAYIQIALNIWLCLIDTGFKLYLNPYESKFGCYMQSMNDVIVLLLSQFIFVFTDVTGSQEDKYFIGWVYLTFVGYLVSTNVFFMVFHAVSNAVNALKRKFFIRKKNQILAQNKAAYYNK